MIREIGIYIFLIVCIAPWWFFAIPSHRTHSNIGKVNLGWVGRCFGSKTGWVDRTNFAVQVAAISIILWDILLNALDYKNTLGVSAFLGLLMIPLIRVLLRVIFGA